MDRKIIKIMAIILIIGISVPVIVTGMSNQESIISLFSKREPSVDIENNSNKILLLENLAERVDDVEIISEEYFNIQGKWGIYKTSSEGIFKGFEEENKIYGKGWYNYEKVYFYIQMNKYLRTFDGVVLYNDNFYSIDGNYIKKDGKLVALWTCEDIDGWIAGELL